MKWAVLDVGGTNTRLGVSANGESLDRVEIWPTPPTYADGISQILTHIGPDVPQYIAVGIAGIWDRRQNRVVRAPNLPEWVGKDIKGDLGGQVIVENDAALAGLGEASMGAGRRYGLVAFLTISTGIGGARIVNGELDQRWWGFEPGHQLIGPVDWEDLASGRAMTKLYGRPPEEIEDPAVWEKEAEWLALGLHNVIVMWSPEIVVLGGAVMNKADVEKIKLLTSGMLKSHPQMPEVVRGDLGDKAGLYGGLLQLRQRFRY